MWRSPLGDILKYVPTGATRFPKENDMHQASKRHDLRSSSVTRDERRYRRGWWRRIQRGMNSPRSREIPPTHLTLFV